MAEIVWDETVELAEYRGEVLTTRLEMSTSEAETLSADSTHIADEALVISKVHNEVLVRGRM